MRNRRPVYLNLLKIRQPLPALVSILHRVSGAVLFLLLPFMLYALERSLADATAFARVQASPAIRLLAFAALACYTFHLLAGIRFLLFDLHRPGLYRHMRSSAGMILAVTAVTIALAGAWLW